MGFVFEHKKKAVIAAEQKYDARRKHKRTTKKAFVFFLLMASISPKTWRKNDKSCFRSDLTGQLFWARKNKQNISMVFLSK